MADIFDQIHAETAAPPPATGDVFDQVHQESQQQSQKPAWNWHMLLPVLGAGASSPNVTPTTEDRNRAIDLARPFVAGAAGDVAGGAAASTGIGALAAPAAYGGTYSAVDAALQYLKDPRPTSLGSALTEGAAQAAFQKLSTGAIKALFRGGKAAMLADQPEIQQLFPTTSQAAKAAGNSVPLRALSTVAKTAEDVFAPGTKAAALDRSAGAGFSKALSMAQNFQADPEGAMARQFKFVGTPQQTELPTAPFNIKDLQDPNKMFSKIQELLPTTTKETGSYQPFRKGQAFQLPTEETNPVVGSFKQLDKVISDPDKLQEVLGRASEQGVGYNLKRSLASYKFASMFNDATEKQLDGSIRINPEKLSSEWLNKDMQKSFETLYSKDQRNTIQQFFQNVSAVQDQTPTGNYRNFRLLYGGVALGTGLITGSMAGVEHGAAVGGVFLGANVVGRLLTNPKVGRILTAMAGGEPLGVSSQYASKVISQALQGTTVALINADGSRTPVQVDNGKFVSVR